MVTGVKLSQIASSSNTPRDGDTILGVTASSQDVRFSVPQSHRIRLIANTTYYVSTTGNDSNDGTTTAAAWLTLQHAVSYIGQNIDCNGWIVILQLAHGTYPGPWQSFYPINGVFQINGDINSPGSVVITDAPAGVAVGLFTCWEVDNFGALLWFSNLTFSPQTSITTATEVDAVSTAVYYTNCNFIGNTNTNDGIIVFNSNVAVFFGADPNFFLPDGTIVNNPGFAGANISGTWRNFLAAEADLVEFIIANNIVLQSTPVWTNFAFLSGCNNACFATPAVWATTFTGSATGSRFELLGECSITTGGQGLSFFPGNSAGSGQVCCTYDGQPFAEQISGTPTTSNLAAGMWGVFKDTSGGGVYVAYNDAGTIKKVALV